MSKEVKLFFIMPGAVPVLQSDSPAYTPMTNCETDVHTVPVVLGEDYDALLAENETLRDLYKMHQQTETREMLDLRAERDALLAERDRMATALDEIGGLCRALRQGGPDPMDLEDLSNALEQAVDLAHAALQGAQP